MSLCISILGGGLRQFYMLEYLLTHLCRESQIKAPTDVIIKYYQTSFPDELIKPLKRVYPKRLISCKNLAKLMDTDILICPVPFTRDHLVINETSTAISNFINLKKLPPVIWGGNIPSDIAGALTDHSHTVRDFMKETQFLSVNASLTAEGLIKYIIENTNFSIEDANIFLAGYGWCGERIAAKLSALGGNLFIYDKDETAMEKAEKNGYKFFNLSDSCHPASIIAEERTNFDIVINTVPSPIFKAPFLRKLPSHCVIFDIASAPGGFDIDILAGLALNVINCPAIPGKTAPRTAGFAMAKCVLDNIDP